MSDPPEISKPSKPSAAPQLNGNGGEGRGYHSQKPHFPNPPDAVNPDPATLRDQWRFAIRQYSKWYSHAWGTAILAGVSFFALGWVIKGSNPLPSLTKPSPPTDDPSSSSRNCAQDK